jgi:hypothetical protein
MSNGSEGKIVRRKAGQVPPTSPERLAAIEAIPDEAIDYSDIPQMPGGERLVRDEDGRLRRRPSKIREAVAAAMADRKMTAYALWKAARPHCPTLSEAAVGEFLKGKRSIGLDYLEAILTALELAVTSTHSENAPHKFDGVKWFNEMTEEEAEWMTARRAKERAEGENSVHFANMLSVGEIEALMARRSEQARAEAMRAGRAG